MYALPLIRRELAVAVRRPLTLWLRVVWGGGAMGAAVWAILVWGSQKSFSGSVLFYVLSGLADLSILITGFALALDGISRERREGTLPLLFLTDLSARDIVVGKLAAVAATPFLTLLGVFPALAMCQLIGGVSSGELWRSLAALVLALFFTISATLFASTVGRQRITVVITSMLLLILVNPIYLLALALRYPPVLFWTAILVFSLLAAVFLGASAGILGRTWREEPRNEKRTRKEMAPPILQNPGELPLTWMMQRRWRAPSTVRLVYYGSLLLVALAIGVQLAQQQRVIFMLLLLFAVHGIILVAFLTRTAYAFNNDKRDGSLELLLCTPLNNEDIFVGLARFLQVRCIRFLVVVTAFDTIFSLRLWLGKVPDLYVFPITMAGIVWISLYGIRWLGVYRTLMLNTPLISILTTLWRLSFFPTILSAVFLWAPRTNYLKVCVFWVISTGFLALFFGNDARRVLIERGRELLLRPASEKPPHIESEWSFINWENLEESRENLPAYGGT